MLIKIFLVSISSTNIYISFFTFFARAIVFFPLFFVAILGFLSFAKPKVNQRILALAVLHASARPDINQAKRAGAPTRSLRPSRTAFSPLAAPVVHFRSRSFYLLHFPVFICLSRTILFIISPRWKYLSRAIARACVKCNANNVIIRVRKDGGWGGDNHVALRLSGEAPRKIYEAISSQVYSFYQHISCVENTLPKWIISLSI